MSRSRASAATSGPLAYHTHGGAEPDSRVLAEVPERLVALFEEAVVNPTTARLPKTKKQYRDFVAEIRRHQYEKVYGPGGHKAYRKRMYGK